jgi:hypothetical protein
LSNIDVYIVAVGCTADVSEKPCFQKEIYCKDTMYITFEKSNKVVITTNLNNHVYFKRSEIGEDINNMSLRKNHLISTTILLWLQQNMYRPFMLIYNLRTVKVGWSAISDLLNRELIGWDGQRTTNWAVSRWMKSSIGSILTVSCNCEMIMQPDRHQTLYALVLL